MTEELRSAEPSLAKIGKLIAADMAMTAKILQVVNSAFFGLRCHVSKAAHAVDLLGLDTIRALVLSTHVFSQFNSDLLSQADIEHLWEHSVTASNYAKKIAIYEHCDQRMIDDCLTSALLHDAGKLIMAAALRDQYKKVLEVAAAGKGICDAEHEVLGCSHAEIAAYLLGLWGLPGSIVEAVAWHHTPGFSVQSKFSPVVAVHVASIYHEQKAQHPLQDQTPIDTEFLNRIGCLERQKSWREAAEAEDARRSSS